MEGRGYFPATLPFSTQMEYSPALWAYPGFSLTSDPESRLPVDPQLETLQNACRKSIIRAVCLDRLESIHKLPLPTRLKEFLLTFRLPGDFNTDGLHWNYSFHFPYHPHHRTHRVNPAVCKLDGTRVLIKAQNEDIKECTLCTMLGSPLLHQHESDHWACIRHPNLQMCYMKLVDSAIDVICYILEYPVISLKDLTRRLFFTQTLIPEFLIWDVAHKLANVLQHLQSKSVHVELYEPQHFILDERGNVKVESLLLYLPKPGHRSYRTGGAVHNNAIYTAPEQWLGEMDSEKTVVWSLGCLLYEMATLSPAFLLETYTGAIPSTSAATSRPPAIDLQIKGPSGTTTYRSTNDPTGIHLTRFSKPHLPRQYSERLENLISNCLMESIPERPSLQELMDLAELQLEQLKQNYTGPQTLLDLLPKPNLEEETLLHLRPNPNLEDEVD